MTVRVNWLRMCKNRLYIYSMLNSKTNKIMTTLEFKNIASEKLNNLSTNELTLEVKKLTNDFSNSANLILDVALDILMNRMPEEEFIKLCNSL
jgi:hypothetical protein